MRPYRPRGSAASPMANINADTIRRAEEAVGKLASQYRDWVRSDLVKLRDSLATAQAGGEARDGAYREIRRIAHDLRGQGTTFGYPLVTRIAQSVSQTVKERADGADIDAQLSAHFDAIAAVIEGDIADARSGDAAKVIELLQLAIGRAVA
jgi:chemotaxis protein histidine kinase CheA